MKKKILLFFTICFMTSGFSQKNTISGTITGFKDQTKVKLYDFDSKKWIDSSYIINNHFILKNTTENAYPRNLSLALIEDKNPVFVRLFIANENIKITGDRKDIPYDLKITGSKHQDLENILNQQLKTILTERTTLTDFLRTEVEDTSENYKAKVDASDKRVKEIDKQNDSIIKVFISKNLNSYTAMNQLQYAKYNYSKDELISLYKKLDEKYKKSEHGISLLNYIEIGDIVKEGDPFFDFEAKDQTGKTHKLSDFKGQFILLDFTKEYCAPCEAAIKELKTISAKYGDQLKIISFTEEKSELLWKKGLTRNKINWLSLWDGQGDSGKTVMKYGVTGYPNFFLMNTEGTIVKYIDGYSTGILSPEIEKLLKG